VENKSLKVAECDDIRDGVVVWSDHTHQII
jgi:hypothetical protein